MKSEHRLELTSERLASFEGIAATSPQSISRLIKVGRVRYCLLYLGVNVVNVVAEADVAAGVDGADGELVLCRRTSIRATKTVRTRMNVDKNVSLRGTGLKSNCSFWRRRSAMASLPLSPRHQFPASCVKHRTHLRVS